MEAESQIQRLGTLVSLLGVEHDPTNLVSREVAHRLGHEPSPDALSLRTGMYGDSHQISDISVNRVVLITNDSLFILRHHKVWVSPSNLKETAGIMSPQLLEGQIFY